MNNYIGVDIGGTNTKIGIVNSNGELIISSIIKTLSLKGVEVTIERIWDVSKKLITDSKIGINDIKGIGIGVPGPVAKESIVTFFSNFNWPRYINLKEIMERVSNIETKIENDVNVITKGEVIFGVAKNIKNVLMVAVGTGIGGGICLDGNLLSGFSGAAGEIGHMKLKKNGKLCGCGQNGCFEAYASAYGLIREGIFRLMVNNSNLLFKRLGGDIHKLEAKDIFEAAKLGDPFSEELVDYEAEYLAMGIGSLLNIINPEMLVIGGGISFSGDLILNPLKEKLKKYALPVTLDNLLIKIGELGNEAGIKGAAALFI